MIFDDSFLTPGVVLILVVLGGFLFFASLQDGADATKEATTEECGSTGESNDEKVINDILSTLSGLEDQIATLTERVSTLEGIEEDFK